MQMVAEEKGVERDAAVAKAEALQMELNRVAELEQQLQEAAADAAAKAEEVMHLQAALERVQEMVAAHRSEVTTAEEASEGYKQQVRAQPAPPPPFLSLLKLFPHFPSFRLCS